MKNNNRYFGYLRVSTQSQNEDRQVAAMVEFGVPEKNMVIEKQSGKNFDRPRYQQLIERLKEGDVLVVKSIDRLGRDYEEILSQWRIITKEKKVDIVVLDMPLLDTRNQQNLMGIFISDMVLQLLSYVAQTEREYCRTRTIEGLAAARAKGLKLGRREKTMPPEFEAIYSAWKYDAISATKAAKELKVSRNTFLKWAKTWDSKKAISKNEGILTVPRFSGM